DHDVDALGRACPGDGRRHHDGADEQVHDVVQEPMSVLMRPGARTPVMPVLATTIPPNWTAVGRGSSLDPPRMPQTFTSSLCGSGSAGDSTVRGSRRSSQRGSHQLARPSSAIVAGTSTIRTRVASMSTAAAMPTPVVFT